MVLTLKHDSMNISNLLVGSDLAIYKYMKSRKGGTLSLGKGYVYSMSTNQKTNLTSSTAGSKLTSMTHVWPIKWSMISS